MVVPVGDEGGFENIFYQKERVNYFKLKVGS